MRLLALCDTVAAPAGSEAARVSAEAPATANPATTTRWKREVGLFAIVVAPFSTLSSEGSWIVMAVWELLVRTAKRKPNNSR
jgi:hypothetical protein